MQKDGTKGDNAGRRKTDRRKAQAADYKGTDRRTGEDRREPGDRRSPRT